MNEYLDYIKDAKRIEIIVRLDNHAERFFCNFIEHRDDCLIFSNPLSKHGKFSCPLGHVVELHVYTSNGVFKLICRFMNYSDGICTGSLPSDVEKVQRREFIRVNMKINTVITLNTPVFKKNIKTYSRDISARGIKLLLDEDISKYTCKIELSVLFPETIVKTLARIVKISPVVIDSRTYYETSLMFITISEKDIDFIVKKCFEFQALQRRKLLDEKK